MAADGKVAVVDADAVFRTFCLCAGDPRTLVIDVRDKKKWERAHIAGSYCVRVPASGDALLDYSKAEYDLKWSTDVWWGKDCIVYGEAGLKRDHPVVAFLAADKHARSVAVFRDGLEAFQKRFPFLVTPSLRFGANAARRYPSQLHPLLFLGDWSHAEALDRHAELGISAVVTIHNNPENLRLPPGKYSHLKIELADVETADISAHLRPAYDFIEEAMAAKRGVLVHCGAGVSRSATLCIAWLMRKHRWSAQKALEFAKQRRSLVAPNDGFWRTLCALEAQLGIAERSDVDAFVGFHGADAPAPVEIAEPKVRVTFIPAGATSAPAGSMAQTAAPPPPPAAPRHDERRERERERRSSRSRSRDRDRRRRSRSRDRDGRRRRSRSRSRSRERRRDGSRDRQRRRSRSRDRERRGDERGGGGSGAPPPPPEPQEERVDVESTEGAVLEVVREGKALGHLVLELRRVSQEAVFGRLPSCDVPLEHLSVSRAHAQLTADGRGGLALTDLGSAHGTHLDGLWIKARTPKPLRLGSVFKFGASSREFRVAKLPAPPPRP